MSLQVPSIHSPKYSLSTLNGAQTPSTPTTTIQVLYIIPSPLTNLCTEHRLGKICSYYWWVNFLLSSTTLIYFFLPKYVTWIISSHEQPHVLCLLCTELTSLFVLLRVTICLSQDIVNSTTIICIHLYQSKRKVTMSRGDESSTRRCSSRCGTEVKPEAMGQSLRRAFSTVLRWMGRTPGSGTSSFLVNASASHIRLALPAPSQCPLHFSLSGSHCCNDSLGSWQGQEVCTVTVSLHFFPSPYITSWSLGLKRVSCQKQEGSEERRQRRFTGKTPEFPQVCHWYPSPGNSLNSPSPSLPSCGGTHSSRVQMAITMSCRHEDQGRTDSVSLMSYRQGVWERAKGFLYS